MKILTIGVFDGVHRGHQSLLRHLNEQSLLVTFSNHPIEILKGYAPPLLSSHSLKIALLQECGIDHPIVIPFTRTLSETAFDVFLEPFAFQHLLLGEDSVLGREGKGNANALQQLGIQKGFTVQTISKLVIAGLPVSSTRIRSLIQAGKLSEAETLLGRPYCIDYSPDSACNAVLPPDGEYCIWSHSHSGIKISQLTIRNSILLPSENKRQLLSFGPNLNPNLFENLCHQTSLAAS